MEKSRCLKRAERGPHSKLGALQGKALRLEAVRQGQDPVPARVAGAGCRGEWPGVALPSTDGHLEGLGFSCPPVTRGVGWSLTPQDHVPRHRSAREARTQMRQDCR